MLRPPSHPTRYAQCSKKAPRGTLPFHYDSVTLLTEINDLAGAPHLDAEFAGALAEHSLQGLLTHTAEAPLRFALARLIDEK